MLQGWVGKRAAQQGGRQAWIHALLNLLHLHPYGLLFRRNLMHNKQCWQDEKD